MLSKKLVTLSASGILSLSMFSGYASAHTPGECIQEYYKDCEAVYKEPEDLALCQATAVAICSEHSHGPFGDLGLDFTADANDPILSEALSNFSSEHQQLIRDALEAGRQYRESKLKLLNIMIRIQLSKEKAEGYDHPEKQE